MIRAIVLLAALLPGSVQSSVFARPEIVYASGKTVGVRYVSVGADKIRAWERRSSPYVDDCMRAAGYRLKGECKGSYEPMIRSKERGEAPSSSLMRVG